MSSNQILLEGIALKKCVAVTYNRVRMLLAPHVLYTRHDDLFIDAVAVETAGRPPREIKLGTFKLAGLSDLDLSERPFDVQPVFDPGDERYAGVTLFVVEP